MVQGENERKKMVDRLDTSTADVKRFKDELHMLKDVIRRQQEAKHLELKEEFLGFTTQMEQLIGEIQLAKGLTQTQQADLNASYARSEQLQDQIKKLEARIG